LENKKGGVRGVQVQSTKSDKDEDEKQKIMTRQLSFYPAQLLHCFFHSTFNYRPILFAFSITERLN
tara:strand:+ start:104 stop:301 length:198 start_codon:yes stop_codon:yes gene_type:complete